MCGIAGFVGPGDRDVVIRMTAALAHRGPDGEGFLIDPERAVFLGHRRLSIIDLAHGAQPFFNEDGRVAVVFNGEIYNHLELRTQLQALGHRFTSDHCDTEVLVHGYEEWGSSLPLRLNGMFAFAIYDMNRRRLFLSRDRFGEKPLYYTMQNRIFAFASELTALTAHPGLAFSIDQLGLQKFFAHGFTPAPNTIYRHCRKLPAGHSMTFDLTDQALDIRCFWKFSLEPDPSLSAENEPRLAEELQALIFQAVRRRLISDVPLGIFLSGGMDSAAILAGAVRCREAASLDTFTIGFSEPTFDESVWARQAASFYGARHHEEQLDLQATRELIAPILGRLDEPSGDPSILPTFLVSRLACRDVKVVLTGDGGDELFAGYDPFRALLPARLYHRLMPALAHRGVRCLADLLPISRRNMSFDFMLRRFLSGLSYPEPLWNPVWLAPVEPRDVTDLVMGSVSVAALYSEVLEDWESNTGGKFIDRILSFYTRFYLQDDILMKVDRASMMNSLESRAAFLDNDLVEFCRRLPARFKFAGGRGKHLLRRALRGVVPDQILDRPKKGFGIPVSKWLRELAAPENLDLAGLKPGVGSRLWQEHARGEKDHRLVLWCYMSLYYHFKGMR